MLSDVSRDKLNASDINSIAKSLLPKLRDDQKLKENISTLIARVLCTHLDFFRMSFDGIVNWHVKHRFYQEMSKKSVVVSMSLSLNSY